MANNTEVIFENIEQRIIKEIKDAHYAIFVSVAWFTNKKLFNALLEKAKNNCYVSIIIQLDEINSQSGIDYSQIEIGRSECFKISKDAELLHDKFCVIDFKKVITGSYNWTYKAAHNSENILILDDPTVATQYISRFELQKSKYAPSSAQQGTTIPSETKTIVDTPKVVKAPPTTKQCPSCNRTIEHNTVFCKYCGYDIKSYLKGIDIYVECKKCSQRQEDALNDAARSNFCTYCGSKELKWRARLKKK